MGRTVPGPDDFVAPGMVTEADAGSMKPVNERVFEKIDVEAGDEDLRGGREEPADAIDPRARVFNNPQMFGRPQTGQFQPVNELARQEELTIVFQVLDNRPFILLPLTGPGTYQVIVRKSVENPEGMETKP